MWQPSIRLELTISVGYDWDRQSLEIEVALGFGLPVGGGTGVLLVDEPISPANAARVVLGKLLPKFNKRLTATGSCVGNAAIRVGRVLRIEGVARRRPQRTLGSTRRCTGGCERRSWRARPWTCTCAARSRPAPTHAGDRS